MTQRHLQLMPMLAIDKVFVDSKFYAFSFVFKSKNFKPM